MASIFRSQLFRGFIAFLFFGAALFVGWLAVSLIGEAVGGHGSFGGNIFRFGFGLMALVLSPLALIFGIIYWRSSKPESDV